MAIAMDVQLGFGARQQFDKGGPLGAAIKEASTLLAAETLPKGAVKLSREEALEEGILDEEDQEDDDEEETESEAEVEDDAVEPDDGNNIWVIAVGGRNVYFAQPTDDQPARLILRAV